MLRWLVISIVILASPLAGARPLPHTDLAGLILQSEAVAIADRVGPSPQPGPGGTPLTRYQVVKVLRGQLAAATVDVHDQLYVSSGHTLDARAVLFLAKRNGDPWLVGSGLRVLENGKVLRFEQHRNPGPYAMVPQGPDPQTHWQPATAQLDLAGLERAIADAGARVDRLTAARAERDPGKRRAALLALFVAGDAQGIGFYLDKLAHEAKALLGASDLEGALMLDLRDRSAGWLRGDFAGIAALMAFAADRTKPAELRAAAIAAAARHSGWHADEAAMRGAISLIADPAPRVREAAVEAAASPAGMMSSDPAENRKLKAIAADARAAMARQYAGEQDARVLVAIAAAYEDRFSAALPARRGGPAYAARAHLEGGHVRVDVRCLRPGAKAKPGPVTAKTNSAQLRVSAFSVAVSCAGGVSLASGGTTPLGAGRYELSVEISDGKPVELPLGTLAIDASREMFLTLP